MAKNDGECLNIMIRVLNLFFKEITRDKHTINMLTDIILSELKSIKGLEDIQENIEYKNYLTPLDTEEILKNINN